MQLVAILAGIFCITAAALDWDWFMNHRKAEFWVRLFGHDGARVFYMILGGIIVALGLTVCAP